MPPDVQRSAVSERAELELDELELDPPPPFPPPFPPFPPPPLEELELLDELDPPLLEPLDEELDDEPDPEELLDEELVDVVELVDELVLDVDEVVVLVLDVDGLELDETMGGDTEVGSVMPTQAAAMAVGALTSSNRKLRRAVSSGWPVPAFLRVSCGCRVSPLIAVLLPESSTRSVESHRRP